MYKMEPSHLLFLLRYWNKYGDDILKIVTAVFNIIVPYIMTALDNIKNVITWVKYGISITPHVRIFDTIWKTANKIKAVSKYLQ